MFNYFKHYNYNYKNSKGVECENKMVIVLKLKLYSEIDKGNKTTAAWVGCSRIFNVYLVLFDQSNFEKIYGEIMEK